MPLQVMAQMPTVVDPSQPATPTTTAAISKIKVSCQDLKTVVEKGDRQATMMTWNSNHFGKEFSNKKRCQIVSERLQKAANQNGGTFQGLQLASGTVNFQAVVCALPTSSGKCDKENMLFTLKPENANNPQVVIQQILTFAEEGNGSVEESSGSSRKVDVNLGGWERRAFAPQVKVAPTKPNSSKNGGF